MEGMRSEGKVAEFGMGKEVKVASSAMEMMGMGKVVKVTILGIEIIGRGRGRASKRNVE